MNATPTTTYNGWTNYETWAVNLWLSNDHGTYLHWTERTREYLAEGRDEAIDSLATELENAITDECEISKASLASDLMNAALGEVNWHEIATAWVDDNSGK